MSVINDFFVDIETSLALDTATLAPPSLETKRIPIPKVPLEVLSRESSQRYFNPTVVFFGPYHHGNSKYEGMETVKKKLVRQFFIEWKLPVRKIYEKIHENIMQVRNCYEEHRTSTFDDDKLTFMMLIDGTFFILCLFFRESYYSEVGQTEMMSCYLDLHLLENQIPFSVLWVILQSSTMLARHFVCFTDMFNTCTYFAPSEWVSDTYFHHLDKLQKVTQGDRKTSTAVYDFRSHSYSVREIVANGVHLTRGLGFDDVRFSSKFIQAELTVPRLEVDEFTFHYLANLCAYEFSQGTDCEPVFTSYIWFLDSLIKGVEDIRELQSAGIVSFSPLLPFKEESLIHFIKGGFGRLAYHRLAPVYAEYYFVSENVKEYMKTKWKGNIRTWMTEVRTEYCKSPWKGLAVLAGFVLFFLTATQTYFTVFPRKR